MNTADQVFASIRDVYAARVLINAARNNQNFGDMIAAGRDDSRAYWLGYLIMLDIAFGVPILPPGITDVRSALTGIEWRQIFEREHLDRDLVNATAVEMLRDSLAARRDRHGR
jgi:hypothetical protein